MVNLSAKTLALVLSAIKNLREIKGSTSREILRYITSVYDIPHDVARRQMQATLKRGVAYGILKKNGNNYILPTDTEAECQEIAAQELGLLDLRCRRKRRQKRRSQRGCKKRSGRSKKHGRRGDCKCKRKKSRRKKKRSSRGCKKRSRRKRSRKGKGKCICEELKKKEDRPKCRTRSPSIKLADRTSTELTATANVRSSSERSRSSTPSIEQRDDVIPLPY